MHIGQYSIVVVTIRRHCLPKLGPVTALSIRLLDIIEFRSKTRLSSSFDTYLFVHLLCLDPTAGRRGSGKVFIHVPTGNALRGGPLLLIELRLMARF